MTSSITLELALTARRRSRPARTRDAVRKCVAGQPVVSAFSAAGREQNCEMAFSRGRTVGVDDGRTDSAIQQVGPA